MENTTQRKRDPKKKFDFLEWKTPHKEREMAFCYVNALFKDTIKRDCPDEVVKIITCYAKSMRLFKSVNDQLNICPRMAQFEQWEKEAKAFKNAKVLREQLKTLLGTIRVKRDWLMPHCDGGITRWMLEASYVNHTIYKHIKDQVDKVETVFGKRFRKDKRWIEFKEPDDISPDARLEQMLSEAYLPKLQEQSFYVQEPLRREIIRASSGNRRSFSRHPMHIKVYISDWIKTLVLKDTHDYILDNRGLYYIEEDGVVRPR